MHFQSKPFFLSKKDEFINELEVDGTNQSQIVPSGIGVKSKEICEDKNQVHNEHPYSKICAICPESNKTIMSMKRDKKYHYSLICYWKKRFHVVNQKLYKLKNPVSERFLKPTCELCNKPFNSSKALKSHIKYVHEGVKDFHCEKCGKGFTNLHSLDIHIKCVHEGIKDHLCPICDFKTGRVDTLKYHISSVHEGVKKPKNHKCDICGKAFSIISKLKIHMKHHNGIEDFECNYCGKGFVDNKTLKRHFQAVHQRLKNHKCDICDKSFAEKANLRKHIKSVHEGIKDKECLHCGKKFSHGGNLNKHIKSNHEV